MMPPLIAKSFISTEISNTYNSNTQVVIGEYASYQVVVTVPEGVTQNARIVDTLDAGLAFVGSNFRNPINWVVDFWIHHSRNYQ